MARRRIVILGGTLAGPTAAARARERDEDAEITIVQRGAQLSFGFAGLHHHLSGEVPSLGALDTHDAGFFRDYYGVTALLRTEATALDLGKRTLAVTGPDGPRLLPFDSFVFALGAESVSLPQLAGENVWRLRTFDDARQLRERVAAGGKRVVVVGGGSFGVEAVDGLVRAGAEVTLVEQRGRLLPRFSTAAAAIVVEHLRTRCAVKLGVSVESARSEGGVVTAVVLDDGSVIDVDAVVVCAGVRPRTQLLQRAGVALEEDGSVAVNLRGEVKGADGVWACGASVAVPAVFGGHRWWAQAAIADKVAQVAGDNAAGGAAACAPFTGTMLVRALDVTVGRTGLSYDEAVAVCGKGDVDRTLLPGRSHEAWFPRSSELVVEVLSQRSLGVVLGVEAVGAAGVDKRVDVAAAAIAGGLTVERLAALDLGCAGAYNGTRDVLNTAASVAVAERDGSGNSIAPAELFARDDWQIVDVRTHVEGPGIPGAIPLPLSLLRARENELDKSRPTVVYSAHGRRGWLAMRVLRQRGFADVRNLAGGLEAALREQKAR